jgi:hypothetical protein
MKKKVPLDGSFYMGALQVLSCGLSPVDHGKNNRRFLGFARSDRFMDE